MHLGFLTPEFPHPRTAPSAGIGSSLYNLTKGLVEKGVEVSVFLYGQQEDTIFREAGIKFHLIKQQDFRFLGWFLYRKFLQNYLNKYITADRINAIEAPDWTGITAFMSLKCPLVIRLHGTDAYFCNLEGRKQKWKNFWFEKKAITAADHLLSVSEFTAKETAHIFNLQQSIAVIPNSVDVGRFKPLEVEIVPNRLLYFGSLIRKKGVLELSGIFNEIIEKKPETSMVLLGKDVVDVLEKRSTLDLFLKNLSKKARNRVEYHPEVGYEEVRQQLRAAAAVLLPSFAEALPMTWLEAMAMEKALVTSNIGWANEVMQDGETGFTEAPKNHKAFAEKVLKLLDNPTLAEEMGMVARKQVCRKFSTEVVIQQNIEFYRRLCD